MPFPTYVSDFVATSAGLSLIKAFMDIKRSSLRRSIVHLVEEMADDDCLASPCGKNRNGASDGNGAMLQIGSLSPRKRSCSTRYRPSF